VNIESIHTNTILQEFKTEGHSPLLVLGSDYEMYVAKNDKAKEPAYALINEFFAAYCLEHWRIESPFVKLIDLHTDLIKLQDDLSSNHKPHYYHIPCFGSKYIKNAIDINDLLITDNKKAYNKIHNPLDIFHITLFDTWVENDDRKPTNYNLILKPNGNKYKVIPIDNAFIFSTMSYQDLNPEYVSVSVNDHLLVSELGHLIKTYTRIDDDFIKNEREYFYLCLERCEQGFDEFMKQLITVYGISDDSISSLKEFLFNKERNTKVFDEYVYRLGQ
jgi:hypothetical protein